MKILFIRANQGKPDPRVEKEMYSLSKRHQVELLGWDRTQYKRKVVHREYSIRDKMFVFHHICITAPQGGGFKKILFPMIRFWFYEFKFLKKHIKEYDALHICDFDTAIPILLLRHNKKIVYDIFDYYSDSKKAPKIIKAMIRHLENKMINRSDVTIICSEKRKEQIIGAKYNKLVVLHNSPAMFPINTEIILKKSEEIVNRIKAVYVGVLSEGRFLKEMADVIVSRLDVEWHVAGFGELAGYFEQLEKKYNNIFYYGKIDYEMALSLETQCDIMTAIYDPIVPNHKYAAPNKFYEALMLGKPIIMIGDTGMDSYVKKYDIGAVIDYPSVDFIEGFERAIDEIKNARNDWENIEVIARRLYDGEFSWNEMESRLLRVYDLLFVD